MDWAFKGVERMNVVGIIEILRAVPYFVLVLIWVKTPAHALRIPIFYFLSAALAAFLGLALFSRDYGWLRPFHDRSDVLEVVDARVSAARLRVHAFASLLPGLNTVALADLRGDVLVGWYSAAYKTVAFFMLVLGGLFF